MAEVTFSRQALEDIHSISEYIQRDSLLYAENQVEMFFESADTLSVFPLAGRVVPEVSQKSIREIIIGSYRVIYWVESKEKVSILLVHHSSRKLTRKHIGNRKKGNS